MLIRLEPASGQALYQQIVDQVKHMVAAGTLRPDDKLPTVRDLASQLIVNPNTIAHAYQQLEREKVIETRRGLGSFVSNSNSPMNYEMRRKLVIDIIDRALVEAHHVDISDEEVRAILEERIAQLDKLEVNAQ